MNIWPASPVPAGTTRQIYWAMDENYFDSGLYQAVTPYTRPFYRYSIPYQNYNEIKQALILPFFNQQRRGGNTPFLIKDPYDYRVNSVVGVRSGYATGSGTLYLYDTNSFMIRVQTTTIGSMFSSLSGWVTFGSEYTYDTDTALLTINIKNATDVWRVNSAQYFRKVVFATNMNEQAVVWNVFNQTIELREIG